MPMPAITIRTATEQDVALLCKLGADTFYETFAKDNTEADMQAYLQTNYNTERITNELQALGATFYIAEADGQPAGFAKVQLGKTETSITAQRPMELERIYVLQACQGLQLGKALLQQCIAAANAAGCDVLWLGVWEHNHKAQRFYERAGFTFCGSHVFWVGSDAQTDLLMMLRL